MTNAEFYLEDLKTKFRKINPNKYYLSYSGGKDSHLLYWFIKEYATEFSNIEIVGCNTGMEFKEILDRIYENADILVWKKKSATPNNVSSNKMTRIVEFVYVFCRRNEFYTFTSNKKILKRRKTGQAIFENVFNFFEASNNDKSTEINKATFSTEFVNQLLNRYVLANDIVMDNFSGTGTTLLACIKRNVKAIGIELSNKQCEYTRERISNFLSNDQISLFETVEDKK